MQREVRFKYLYSDGINFLTEIFTLDQIQNGEPFEVLENEPLLKNYKCIARLQFTGLFDKNNKPIYEGDIVRDGVGNIDKIVFHASGFFAIQRNGVDHSFIENNRIEVIGNKFQHPELLES